MNCSGLTSITIGSDVIQICASAFHGCSGLEKVIVPNIDAWCNSTLFTHSSPLTIAHHLFSDEETEIIDLVIPNSVTHIGKCTFEECTYLSSASIPNSVTSIGNYAFYNCSGLTSIIIPDNVTSIGEYAFMNCKGLNSVTIGNSGRNAFSACSGLTSLTIPNSVKTISGWAFSGCKSLISVTIPNSVTSIGTYAFSNCRNIIDVYCFAENVPSIDSYTFYEVYGHAKLHVPAASIENYKADEYWSKFKTIVALTDNEIDRIESCTTDQSPKGEMRWYDLSGHKLDKPQKGLNIVVMQDGTTRKVVVR